MQLSIIIVNYKTYKLTKQTIESVIREEHDFEYEIILVDNASNDGSIEKIETDFKELVQERILCIYKNNENAGFAKANNIGINLSKGEYILLLNSDTVIIGKCLEESLRKIISNPEIGALGAQVLLPDGRLDHACKRGFPTISASLYYMFKLDKLNPQKYGQYDALYLGKDEEGEVDCLMGAYMLMPKKVLNQVGLLDESYFMYGEDIDLCYRIKEAGYKILYYPKAKIIHYKGGSSTKKRKKVIHDFHEAMWIFYKKHYYKSHPVWINFLVYGGIRLKYSLELLKNILKLKK